MAMASFIGSLKFVAIAVGSVVEAIFVSPRSIELRVRKSNETASERGKFVGIFLSIRR